MGGEQSKRRGLAPESFRVAYPLSEGSYGTIWKVSCVICSFFLFVTFLAVFLSSPALFAAAFFFFFFFFIFLFFSVYLSFLKLFFFFKVTLRDTKEEFSMKSLPLSVVAKEKLMDNLMLERDIMLTIGKRFLFSSSSSPIPQFPNSPIPQFPNSPIPQFPNSPIPQFPNSPIPQFPFFSLTPLPL